ncbi:uncharacterized protein LY89DRAFT_729037 [Mollisia scopiformis]|uniref:Zn(2)-C6 fungal-type domain-containing protein n=1 Tax=Mollisia scopiformis TaxID=149040 RepID=A0A194XP54_MOLSC|nr:uncharacterized protein LY89DRAFT_729037 [Mollisia scopiformis]KUJ21517.1 hypothetical protein LY89DRAFT_729037 [Mollisia scopiformis]
MQSPPSILNRRGGILGRRNGLQPACESCRKAKVRCDIAASDTICARCKKRKKPVPCIFLEAPMTKSKRESSTEQATSPIQTMNPLSVRSPTLSTSTPKSVHSAFSQKTVEISGFLGSTSYSATLQHPELHPDEGNINVQAEKVNLDPRDIATGIHILKYLPDENTCQVFLDLYLQNTVGIIGLPKRSMKTILGSIFTFGSSLNYPYDDEKLAAVSSQIIENGQATTDEPDDANEWIESMSGKTNLRWDIIGILFVAFAYAIIAAPDGVYTLIDERLASRDRKVVVKELKKCIEGCIELSKKRLTPMFVNLLYKNLLLETILEGDACLSVWRLHHDLAAVTTAIGLHCYQGTPNVTLRSEMTKRLSAACFFNDKEIAMFTGRPPALSHRYYTCPLPLDLDDDVLMEGGEPLQRAIEALDENGWNRKGEVCEATISRRRFLSALIQDEVMELFIGNPTHFSMERVNALKDRTVDTFSAVPHLITATKEQLNASDSTYVFWRLLFGRLDYLRIHFFLERLSVERGFESKQKLLDVSREMVDLTVYLWLQRDRTLARRYDFDYLIICYGMPSTGILCAELLRQIRYPKTVDVKVPCSEVVRNLNFMIGFLEWIAPEAGNYKLCQHMAQIIKRVLEKVFEPAPVEEALISDRQLESFDANLWGIDGVDDFDWLNSVDWGRRPFPDVPAA